MELKWEKLECTKDFDEAVGKGWVLRARVPGGWLIMTVVMGPIHGLDTVFVPDPPGKAEG